MLAHVGGHHGLPAGQPVHLVQHVLGLQAALLPVLQGVLLAPGGALLHPVGGVQLAHQRKQRLHAPARVANHGDVGLDDLPELGGIDVQVELWRSRTEFGELPHDAVVPAGSDREDQVAVHHRLVGVGRSVHPQHAHVERMVLAHGALGQKRVHHRCLQLVGELGDGLPGTGNHGTLPDVQHRLARAREVLGRLREHGLVRHARDLVAWQVHGIHERSRAGRRGHVLGQVQEHGAGTARGRDVERFLHDPGEIVHLLHQVGVLDHGIGDAGHVGFLERVLAQHRRDGLPAEHDDGRRIHLGGEDAGHRVGGPGPGGHQHHAGLPGGARVPVGHVGGALFVTHQDQLDLRMVHQGVEQRDGGTSRIAEDVFHPFADEALDDHVRPGGDLLVHCLRSSRTVGVGTCFRLAANSGCPPTVTKIENKSSKVKFVGQDGRETGKFGA